MPTISVSGSPVGNNGAGIQVFPLHLYNILNRAARGIFTVYAIPVDVADASGRRMPLGYCKDGRTFDYAGVAIA